MLLSKALSTVLSIADYRPDGGVTIYPSRFGQLRRKRAGGDFFQGGPSLLHSYCVVDIVTDNFTLRY